MDKQNARSEWCSNVSVFLDHVIPFVSYHWSGWQGLLLDTYLGGRGLSGVVGVKTSLYKFSVWSLYIFMTTGLLSFIVGPVRESLKQLNKQPI